MCSLVPPQTFVTSVARLLMFCFLDRPRAARSTFGRVLCVLRCRSPTLLCQGLYPRTSLQSGRFWTRTSTRWYRNPTFGRLMGVFHKGVKPRGEDDGVEVITPSKGVIGSGSGTGP